MTNDFARPTEHTPSTIKDVFTEHKTEYKKLTILLDPDLHRQFQIAAMTNNRTMTSVIKEKITEYLNEVNG